jgi:HK97 family phage major capsid protein
MQPTDPAYLNAFKAHMRKGDIRRGHGAMSVGVATDGGYLAPIEWDRTISDKLKQNSPIRENSQVITSRRPGLHPGLQ